MDIFKNKHLIKGFQAASFDNAIAELESAHDFLAKLCQQATNLSSIRSFGVQTKRQLLDLPSNGRPEFIGKGKEGIAECINQLATVERMLDALRWFQTQFPNAKVICHPSTSSGSSEEGKGNDIQVLDENNGNVLAICEVSDIASSQRSHNGKAAKEIASLGITPQGFPNDNNRRFICTSEQFAKAIHPGKVGLCKYHYVLQGANDETSLLEVTPWSENEPGR